MPDSPAPASEISRAPALERGERHPAVAEVQRFLELYGYLPAGKAEPAVIDKVTAAAITAYQQFHRLPETGDLDPATRDLMTRPRCGNPDLDAGLRFAVYRPQAHLDLSFVFGRGTGDIEGEAEFDPVRSAFCTWAATGNFAFREIRGEDADFRLSWTSQGDEDFDFPPGGSALAHAFYPPPPQHVHFQDGYTWGLEELYVGFDTETVALHEIGHLVGLKHSSVEGAIMLPEYPGVERRELNPDDLAAVEALYPAPGLLASSIVFQFRQHFGNEEDLLPGTFVGRAEEYRFDCPRVDRREQAFLHFLARHVSNDANLLIVNGQGLAGGVPRTSGEDAWSGHVVLIPDGVLNTVANTLRVESRNGSGGTDGDVDDFVLDNMVVVYPTIRWGCVVLS